MQSVVEHSTPPTLPPYNIKVESSILDLSVHSLDVPSGSMSLLILFSSFLKQSKDPATGRVINTMSPPTLMENHSLAGRRTPASACGAAGLKGAVDVDADGKRHRLPFCHQPSVACLSTIAAVKRSER